jgi:hypothetical protein
MNFEQELYTKEPNFNRHYFKRYMKILESLKYLDSDNTENHHILPKSIFPEYIKTKENIVAVPTKWHYLLHWITIKVFPKGVYRDKMTFAFNQMKRVVCSKKKKGVLYQLSRDYIADAVSRNNTGRIKPESVKQELSERTKDTLVVKDKDGNQFRVANTDPRYLSGELVFYRTGSKHSEETINRMKENSGIKGKIPCFNEDNVVKYFYNHEVPEGWQKGNPVHVGVKRRDETKDKMKKRWEERPVLICPHCGKTSNNKGNMTRYHFNNCKRKG